MIDPSRVYRARQIVEETGCPRAMVYEALASGELPAVRRGRSWIVSGAALIKFIEAMGR